ncbi:MAG: BT_3928 family protein, partial [Ferruginibacter sp.]
MRIAVNIARILTGLLFIFSGLVKGIDPRGLAYKMQEFFEAWANAGFMKSMMMSLNDYALPFSLIMITLEVMVGVALLIGWQKKITTWILLLLILFFTFLTSYVLFSGKIRACGCFGDCIPLTPIQTFTKDIILLFFSLLLLVKREYIQPIAKPLINNLAMAIALLATVFLQWYVLRHLPLIDCLPYKKGNNILELRKMPADAVQDKFDYSFIYEKDGQKKEFSAQQLPDSTWKFSERKQKLIQKGNNNVPLINDFSLTDQDGINQTDSILNTPAEYSLFFIKEVPPDNGWIEKYRTFYHNSETQNKRVYVITAQVNGVIDFFIKHNLLADDFLSADATAIKTAARVNPTLFKMRGPLVLDKLSWA